MSEEHGECFECGMDQTDEDGTLCHGCEIWICDNCSMNDGVSGFAHEPDDHLVPSACCGAKIFDGHCSVCEEVAIE